MPFFGSLFVFFNTLDALVFLFCSTFFFFVSSLFFSATSLLFSSLFSTLSFISMLDLFCFLFFVSIGFCSKVQVLLFSWREFCGIFIRYSTFFFVLVGLENDMKGAFQVKTLPFGETVNFRVNVKIHVLKMLLSWERLFLSSTYFFCLHPKNHW